MDLYVCLCLSCAVSLPRRVLPSHYISGRCLPISLWMASSSHLKLRGVRVTLNLYLDSDSVLLGRGIPCHDNVDTCQGPIDSSVWVSRLSRSHRVSGSVRSEEMCNLAAPRRGGRHLWEWSFIEFCEMVLRATWTVLGVRRSFPANQALDERFFR
jgi:hypothetical protein